MRNYDYSVPMALISILCSLVVVTPYKILWYILGAIGLVFSAASIFIVVTSYKAEKMITEDGIKYIACKSNTSMYDLYALRAYKRRLFFIEITIFYVAILNISAWIIFMVGVMQGWGV